MTDFITYTLFSLYLTSTFFVTNEAKFSHQYPNTSPIAKLNNMTHLHFYCHHIISGKNPTAKRIAGPKNEFGTTMVMDDPLTKGPEPHSKIVGRAEGVYALASQHGLGLVVVMNLAFEEGKYNGSALSILGRNPVFKAVSEMSVIGGSGVFRVARGYALAKTVRYNEKSGHAIVEYDLFVRHG